jgi:sulfur carrier protein ThiS
MTKKVILLVNDASIAVDYFVEGYIDHVVGGMLASLEGTGEIEVLDMTIEGDEVAVDLNNAPVRLSAFPQKIIKSTVTGMISVLKGVGEIDKVKISIRR